MKHPPLQKDIFKGRTVIVGIGNTLKGDDGFGPAFVERLKGNIRSVCIDAGSAPENYIGRIVRENPDTILFVDAAHLDLPAGQYRLLASEDLLKGGFTTHDISPRMLIEYLRIQTRAAIFLLGVQPKNISLGSEMSDSVRKSLEVLVKLTKEIDHA